MAPKWGETYRSARAIAPPPPAAGAISPNPVKCTLVSGCLPTQVIGYRLFLKGNGTIDGLFKWCSHTQIFRIALALLEKVLSELGALSPNCCMERDSRCIYVSVLAKERKPLSHRALRILCVMSDNLDHSTFIRL